MRYGNESHASHGIFLLIILESTLKSLNFGFRHSEPPLKVLPLLKKNDIFKSHSEEDNKKLLNNIVNDTFDNWQLTTDS